MAFAAGTVSPNRNFAEDAFVVTVTNVNDPPSISSQPIVFAEVGVPYAYTVQATDPDPGDTLTFAVDSGPTGLAIDPQTGLVTWTPAANQTGANTVTVRVTDALGLFHADTFPIEVTVPNQPLVFVTADRTAKRFSQWDGRANRWNRRCKPV